MNNKLLSNLESLFPKQSHEASWKLPMTKYHAYLLGFIFVFSLIFAICLPPPEEFTADRESSWISTGRVPDIHNKVQNYLYQEDLNATESIDTDTISDTELFSEQVQSSDQTTESDDDISIDIDTEKPSTINALNTKDESIDEKESSKPNEQIVSNPETTPTVESKDPNIQIAKPTIQPTTTKEPEISEQEKAEIDDLNYEWYEQEVVSGDNIYEIIKTMNLDYSNLNKMLNVPKYGAEIKKIKPGQKLYFKLTDKNNLIEFVKPIDKSSQVRFVKNTIGEFVAIKEPLNAHLQTDTEVNSKIIAREPSSQIQPSEEPQKPKEPERVKRTSTLVKFNMDNAKNFTEAAIANGILRKEAYEITKLFKGSLNFNKLNPSDRIIVLFDSPKEGARILAASIDSKRQGRHNIYYIPSTKSYVDDSGSSTRSNKTFLRHPIHPPLRITSKFNPYRKHPITHKVRPHKGTDYGVPIGTNVYAPADGIVRKSTWQKAAGHYLVIEHKGSYTTIYMHLSKILVKVGDHVKANQRIALSGNSGASTGPHLHYELRRNNVPIDSLKATINGIDMTEHASSTSATGKQIAEYKRRMGIAK